MPYSEAGQPDPERRQRLGRQGLAIAGILFVAANLRTAITVAGPLLGDVRAELGLSSVTTSALITIPVLCFALFSPVAPFIAARFGMERTLAGALMTLTVGLVVRSFPAAWGTWGVWAGTAVIGLSIAVLNVILPALLKRDFAERTGSLTGAYSALQSAFAALASGFAVPLANVGGWRFAFGFWAGLVLISLAIFWPQVMRSRPPVKTEPIMLPGGGQVQHRSPWGSALGWQVTLFMGAQSTLFYSLLTWMPSIDEANGFSAATAGTHQSVFQFVGIAGNIVTAWLIQRTGGRGQERIMMFVAPMATTGLLGLLFFPHLSVLWNLVIGFSAGSTIVLALAFFGLRASHHRQAASLSGMAQSVGYLLAAVTPMVLGALHDVTDDWTPVILTLVGLQVLQVTSGFLASRDRKIGRK